MAKNFFLDNEDLKFQLDNLDWDRLFPLVEPDTSDPEAPKNAQEARVLYEEFLRSLGEFIAEKIDPKTHLLDEQHPTLKDGEMHDPPIMKEFMKGLVEMGATALPFPRHVGGFNMPWTVTNMVTEMVARADVSLMTYYSFFSGFGMVFQIFALEEGSFKAEKRKIISTRFDEQMRDVCQGKTSGAMCLTEPQAGSDLGQISTQAVKDKDGYWYLTGQKIWITCGHGEHHLVLARSESKKTHPGMKGLSLFYVPAHIEKDGKKVRNFEIGGQEKKMGQHSLATVTLNYDNSRGELVGKRGDGFRNMALVMNDARLTVGFEGIGLCEKAMRQAKEFAEERVTMGKKIAQHEMIADYLDEMEVENKALRALAFDASFHEEMCNRLHSRLLVENLSKEMKETLEAEHKFHKWQARLSTPMVKYMASENAVRFARTNMQILGGVGYMKEYGAEKLMRDSLIMPVYEGTSQIQALLILKDHLQQTLKNPAKFVSKMATAKVHTLSAKTPEEKMLARLKTIYFGALQSIMTRMMADKFGGLKEKAFTDWKDQFLSSWDPKTDFSFGLLHAERFTLIASRLWMAKILVKQALKIEDKDVRTQRLELASRFMERAEPKMRGLLGEIDASKSSMFRSHLGAHEKKSEKIEELEISA